jgi:hypothetical protein
LHSGKSLLILPTFENGHQLPVTGHRFFSKNKNCFMNKGFGYTGNKKPVTGNQYQAT